MGLLAVLWIGATVGAARADGSDSNNDDGPRSGVARVHDLLRQQLVDEAVDEARRLEMRYPGHVHVVSALGEALFRDGALAEAEALLGGRDDLPPRGLVTLGRLRDARGRAAEAIALMDRAVAESPEDPEILYRAASATTTRREAVRRLEAYVERAGDGDDPDRVEAARGSARVLRALGDRSVWVARNRPDRVELPLRRLWNPGSGRTVGFVVEAEVGDRPKPVRLLLV